MRLSLNDLKNIVGGAVRTTKGRKAKKPRKIHLSGGPGIV